MTPPDTPVEYYPVLAEDGLLADDQDIPDGPRRSRRSTMEIKLVASRLRTQRSRASLESGLRTQQRKIYVESIVVDTWTSSDAETESENEELSTSSSDVESLSQPTKQTPHRSRGRPVRKSSDSDNESPSISGAASPPQPMEQAPRRSRGRPPPTLPQCDGAEDERDDLGITPARTATKRRTSNSNVGKAQWWKVQRGVVGDSEDDGSEDELSFH
jgi:hypothetical protein